MKRTFGDPFGALAGAGHAGLDSSTVRPTTPGKRPPGSYSIKDISSSHQVDVDVMRAPPALCRDDRSSLLVSALVDIALIG
jgi:hypothetical protein